MEIDASKGKWGVLVDHGHMDRGREARWGGPWSALMVVGKDGLLYHMINGQLLTLDTNTGRVRDWGRAVLKTDPKTTLGLGGGGALGTDGKIYCTTRVNGKAGIAVLDPAHVRRNNPVLRRISPRRVIRPGAGRSQRRDTTQ